VKPFCRRGIVNNLPSAAQPGEKVDHGELILRR
jgi:hypothetical protein